VARRRRNVAARAAAAPIVRAVALKGRGESAAGFAA
jgi:hypothetical protein